MPHTLFAFIDLCFSLLMIFLSYKQFSKNRFQTAAIFLVIAAFALRAFTGSDLYLHEWDERYHALVAKNMMQNFLLPRLYPLPLLPYNYHSWSSNYIWLHKQPLPLWCMAASMKVFGACEWALRLPSVMVSSIAVYFTYLIGKKLFDEKTGLLAAFFHAINGLTIEMTGGRIATDHVDIFFLFFVELAVLFAILYYEKRKIIFNILTGLSIGLAVLCKWLPAFIVLVVWLMLNFNKQDYLKTLKNVLLIVAAALLVFIPWQVYTYINFPLEYNNEMMHNYRHFVEVLDGREGGIFYFFEKLFINVNEFVWIAFCFFGYRLYKMNRPRTRMALISWVIFPFIFFTMAKTKMQGYLLFTFPALFIVLSEFCVSLLANKGSLNQSRFQKLIFAIIIFLAVRFNIERMKPLQDQSKQLAWADEFRKMDKTNADKKVYFNVAHCIEGMFYTNSIMYGYLPTPQQADDLKAKGYTVIINQTTGL